MSCACLRSHCRLLSLEQLKNDTAKLNKDQTTCEKQLADAKQQQGTLYAQSEQLTESLREIDRETERLRNELREAEQFAAEQISREAVIQTNIRNCEENIERTRQESATPRRAGAEHGCAACRTARAYFCAE